MLSFSVIYKIKKRILIYKRYAYNSNQGDSNHLANYIYAKIVNISTIDMDLFGHQYELVVQPPRYSPEQPPYCGNVNFGHSFLLNYKSLTCPINKIVQSNWVVMQSNKAV